MPDEPQRGGHVGPPSQPAPLLAAPQDEGQEEGQPRRHQDAEVDEELAEVVDPVGERRPGTGQRGDGAGLDVADQEHDAAADHVTVDRGDRVVRHVGARAERGRQRGRQRGRRRDDPSVTCTCCPDEFRTTSPPSSGWTGWSKLMVTVCGILARCAPCAGDEAVTAACAAAGVAHPTTARHAQDARAPRTGRAQPPSSRRSRLASRTVRDDRRQDWRSQKPMASVRSVLPGQ